MDGWGPTNYFSVAIEITTMSEKVAEQNFMADFILFIYLHPIQAAAINNILPSSLLKDAAKIQMSTKKNKKTQLLARKCSKENSHMLLVGMYIGLITLEHIY